VKILIDSAVVILACLLVFEILSQTATFFTLASSHTTFEQKLIHTMIALVLILLSRTSLMVYRQPWNRMKAMSYIHIIVADAMAGVVFYIVAEFVLHSAYPFLLELSLFMLIDVGTLFYRLLYRGIGEEYGTTEQ